MKMKDITGQRFGRLIAKKPVGSNGRSVLWLCQCDCGGTKIVSCANLGIGQVKSCGCLAVETRKKNWVTHGLGHSKIYHVWCDMMRRCIDTKGKDYPNYGGRGIKVCERWQDVRNFALDMGEPPAKCTLDRIDPNGNYEPSNCRWATQKEQANNKTNNRKIEFRGEIHTLAEWSDIVGINYGALRGRLCIGWSVEEAFTTKLEAESGYKRGYNHHANQN